MKATTKIKLTKIAGYIELIIAVIMIILSFLLDTFRTKAIILTIILLIISFLYRRRREYGVV